MPADLPVLLGRFAGHHALALLAGGIAGTLALLWLGVRATRPWRRADAARWLPWVAGLTLLLLAAVLFGALADEMREGEGLERFDAALAATLRASLDASTLRAMSWLTVLGNGPVMTALGAVVAAGLLWARERRLAATWTIALLGNGLLVTPALKQLFARARPLHDHGWAAADGFSFPSGHASGSMVFFGMLAFLAARRLHGATRAAAVAGCLALLLAVGASRVLLQVHYASDVIAGFAVGAAWLLLCIAVAEATRAFTGPDRPAGSSCRAGNRVPHATAGPPAPARDAAAHARSRR